MALCRSIRHGLLILAMLLFASSCSPRQRLYRAGLAEQRQAEQALAAGDTVQANANTPASGIDF